MLKPIAKIPSSIVGENIKLKAPNNTVLASTVVPQWAAHIKIT
jgi:hypothetical protein